MSGINKALDIHRIAKKKYENIKKKSFITQSARIARVMEAYLKQQEKL